MDDPSATIDDQNMPDDEFLVDGDVNEDAVSVLERLQEFAYYLVENVEINLNFCLALLEERTVPVQSNSFHTNIVSSLFSAIPKVGSAVGKALSKGELMIFEKLDKRNSRILADLIYYYSDHKEHIRTLLIQSAIDIFYSFEYQFRKLTSDVGQKKAMQKLAKDASDRIFNYFLETEQTKNITRTEIAKGVLFGDSKRNKRGIREGRTVIIDDYTWKTNKLYKKSGLVLVEEQAFYKNKDTNTKKYGHRRLLPWEDPEEVKGNWQEENGFELPNYYLTVKEDLYKLIRHYIMTKNPNEEAKLERENYNKDAEEDRKVKHEEVLTTFHDRFKELLDDLEHQYKAISDNHSENKELLEELSHKQDKGEVMHYEIRGKLEELHKDVYDTKALIETNMTLQQNVTANNRQDEISCTSTAISTDVVKEIVATETKEVFEENLTDFLKEKLRKNDPGPRIAKEVRRTLKKFKL